MLRLLWETARLIKRLGVEEKGSLRQPVPLGRATGYNLWVDLDDCFRVQVSLSHGAIPFKQEQSEWLLHVPITRV